MVLVDVKVPVLAESVPDATLLDWKKAPGEAVAQDEILIELETDKVVLEVPAPAAGVLAEIVKATGDRVVSQEVLARIDTEATAGVARPAATPSAGATPATPSAPEPEPATEAARLSPAVRKLVAEHALDPSAITGTGRDGRITKGDVLDHLARQSAAPETPVAAPPAPRPSAAPATAAPAGARGERREPMSRLRSRIAERLKQAQNTAAILTTFNEVDMAPVMALRNRYRDQFEKAHGVKLGFMSFFVKAAVQALNRFPAVNAYIEGDTIVHHDYQDIGIAVGSPRGLVVPILRDAQSLGFAAIEKSIAEFGRKANDGTLSLDDLSGGTFTISNGGVFGSLLSTPILNPPQSAILGMHKTQERPVVVDGQIVVRPMMYLALSYDHRIVDGREAVLFLVTIKEAIEDPARLLLDV
ncbi:MAG: 2-oxoglutarate dehydrogenase complex dihydrolipoyllysine-residue succinyltransferase [Ectothiorhodospiraceae bacterium]|nr:2-oxoglutarate dehydrogenase complex dihydrolipoyllysine-residue succinyltransferase [Ectothiorhodospiraceae bacterium]